MACADRAPLISVALCTYNGARHLPQQLESLLAQDYPNLEIVAVDDASADETPALLEAAARRDPRLRVHRNRRNLGYAKNFERAMQLCHGELIAPSDQDDVWKPAKLSRLAAARGGAALAYCDSLFVDECGRSLGRRVSDTRTMHRGNDPRVLTFANCVSGHALLVRRSVLEQARPFPDGQPHDWWLAFVAASTGGIEYVDECLVEFRQHAASVTDVSGSKDTTRAPASRLSEIEGTTRWLEALAQVPGPHQAFYRDLHGLWLDWQQRYLAPRLARFMFRHADVLWQARRPGQRARHAWRMLWGLRMRRLTQPARYGASRQPPRRPPGAS